MECINSISTNIPIDLRYKSIGTTIINGKKVFDDSFLTKNNGFLVNPEKIVELTKEIYKSFDKAATVRAEFERFGGDKREEVEKVKSLITQGMLASKELNLLL